MRKQRVMTFVSNCGTHAAVWTFMEFMPNDRGDCTDRNTMQDRTGQWWLCARDLYNTKEHALKSIEHRDYYNADEEVFLLCDM